MSATLLALLGGILVAPAASDTFPLFASDEPLELTLVSDLGAIRRDRSDEPEDRPAHLVLPGGDTLEVGLRPRGDFRRDPRYCSFPPLRLNLKRQGTEGTVFGGQDKLKLVGPRLGRGATRAPRADHLRGCLRPVGRLPQVDVPHRKRRGARRPRRGRSGGHPRRERRPACLSPRLRLDPPRGVNTDWSDSGAHNVLILAVGSRIVPVPYDFDFSGAVEAPYAAPAEELPIRSVRQRLYRGWCRPGLDTEDILRGFRDARPAIESLYRDFSLLPERSRQETLEYFAQFFDNIATPELAERRLFRDCMPLR